MQNRKLKYIDLFCGCGGLTEGFETTNNYSLIGGVDWDEKCVITLRNRLRKYSINNPNEKILKCDIRNYEELFNGDKTKKGLDSLVKNQKIDLIIGGPPCQAYSVAGRIRDKEGMQNDYRNYLFEGYLEVVNRYKPKLFVFENVPGILTAKPGGIQITERIYSGFENIGYQIVKDLKTVVFDMSEYGIPQNRKRVIIIGVNKSNYKDPDNVLKTIYEEMRILKVSRKMTVKDAIFDLEPIIPFDRNNRSKKESHQLRSSKISWHLPRFHNDRDIEIFKILAEDLKSGKNKFTTSDSLKRLYTEKTGKSSNVHKYYVLRENEPSNTIVAHLYKDGLRHIHPDPKQARTITVREAARLQTFPDDFDFISGMGDAYKMIGNAVPPKFAEIISNVIYNYIL